VRAIKNYSREKKAELVTQTQAFRNFDESRPKTPNALRRTFTEGFGGSFAGKSDGFKMSMNFYLKTKSTAVSSLESTAAKAAK